MISYLASAQSVLDKGQSIAQEFGVDSNLLIAQAVNFVLCAGIIYKFGFKGILSTIQEREKQISDSLKHAEKIKLELEDAQKRNREETLTEASLKPKKQFQALKNRPSPTSKLRRRMLVIKPRKSFPRQGNPWPLKRNKFLTKPKKKSPPRRPYHR